MAQKKFYKHTVFLLVTFLLSLHSFTIAEQNSSYPPVEITSGNEFVFTRQQPATFTIRPLKSELRAIDNLKNTEAVGVVYLGDIELSKNATPLSALRDVSVQISKGLDIDLALITDSTTSQSLAPHELLLLYHPDLVITLALTKVTHNEVTEESAAESEETSEDNTQAEGNEDTTVDTPQQRGQYSLIGTYAIPPKALPELIAPSEEVALEETEEIAE